jgi:hypothetical protein
MHHYYMYSPYPHPCNPTYGNVAPLAGVLCSILQVDFREFPFHALS